MNNHEYVKLDYLPYGNSPSIKQLESLGLSHNTAKQIKLVMSGKIDLTTFDSANRRIQECYNYPSRLDVSLHVISDLMSHDLGNTYGLEYIRAKNESWYPRGIEYINRGDTYIPTILYIHKTHRFYVSSWGDIVESDSNYYE